ncbi:MAG: hypothetical protein Q4Q33_13570 [Eubacteriales bacterium]|nr:hypothetical protein [Eubacteriales bacterium]
MAKNLAREYPSKNAEAFLNQPERISEVSTEWVELKINMLKSLEIKGFTGGNRENEIRNRWITERRKKYII